LHLEDLEDNSVEHQVNIYIHLIKITKRIKREFEPDIHPTALAKYHNKYHQIVHNLTELILDLLKMPKDDLLLRATYHDLILEHIERRTITEEHLKERLFSWEEFGIIEQAE
jgi:hypothetical protein